MFYHFESQCIPTPAAWYAHHLPQWLLKLGVVGTFVIEIAVPFLFFIPNAGIKLVAFWLQVLFQVSIIITGNYNFFNLLTIILCFSLLNDDQLCSLDVVKRFRRSAHNLTCKICSDRSERSHSATSKLSAVIAYFTYFSLVYWSARIFNVSLNSDGTIDSNIAFSMEDFDKFVLKAIPISIAIGILSLLANIALSLRR